MNDRMFSKDVVLEDLPCKILRDIYQYWLNMKGGRLMPSRVDLDPNDIVNRLPNVSLIDVESKTGRFKCRLVGTDIVKGLAFDPTNKYLDEWPRFERLIKDRFDWLVKEKQPYFVFDQLKLSQNSFLDYYAVGLPLSSNGTDVDILLHALSYELPIERRTEFL